MLQLYSGKTHGLFGLPSFFLMFLILFVWYICSQKEKDIYTDGRNQMLQVLIGMSKLKLEWNALVLNVT